MGVSRLANRILLCVLLGALLSACGDGNGSVLNGEGTPTVTRVSEDRLDNDANGASSHPSISGDGLMVAFQSDATDLVASDSNGVTDVFLRNTQTDATTRISLDNGNLQTNGASRDPSASSNGRYIAFESDATDIDISDNNGLTDIYLRDTQSGTTWVSVDAGGFQANGASRNPSVSSNGRYVAFESDATDINNNDNNGLTDIYLRDTQANTTAWVSVDSGGAQANGASRNPAVSGNGLFVAFESDATDINNNDNNGLTDIYLRDTQANTTAWVS
ncbi:MAG: TolB family protein, partial [Leptospirillia bacterium]